MRYLLGIDLGTSGLKAAIFGLDGTSVDTTIVGGRVLMRNKKLLTLDETAIMGRARELAGKLWQRV